MEEDNTTAAASNGNHAGKKGLIERLQSGDKRNGSLVISDQSPRRISFQKTGECIDHLSIPYSSIDSILLRTGGILLRVRGGEITLAGILTEPIYEALNEERAARIIEVHPNEWGGEEPTVPSIHRIDWELEEL